MQVFLGGIISDFFWRHVGAATLLSCGKRMALKATCACIGKVYNILRGVYIDHIYRCHMTVAAHCAARAKGILVFLDVRI